MSQNTLPRMYVVGSGIVGLSVAEWFSRADKAYQVTLISCAHPFAGSQAAAANLSTKGQVLARHPHFRMKLEGKRLYPIWLQQLLKERAQQGHGTPALQDVLRFGIGHDEFDTNSRRDAQFRRVRQVVEGEDSSWVQLVGERALSYTNEGWVDADFLLDLLRSVLSFRGVQFQQEVFCESSFSQIVLQQEAAVSVIFCTGAWTRSLLESLPVFLPSKFSKSQRLTVGSTFVAKGVCEPLLETSVLHDWVSAQGRVVLSGVSGKVFLSSTTAHVDATLWPDIIHPASVPDLNLQRAIFLQNAHPFASSQFIVEEKSGFRVGYGHEELLLDVVQTHQKTRARLVVCCGVHKSGFLLAPVLGQMVEQVLLGESV